MTSVQLCLRCLRCLCCLYPFSLLSLPFSPLSLFSAVSFLRSLPLLSEPILTVLGLQPTAHHATPSGLGWCSRWLAGQPPVARWSQRRGRGHRLQATVRCQGCLGPVAWTCRRAYFSPDREGRPSFAPKTAMAHPQRSGSLTRIVEDAGSENTSGGEGVGGGGVVEV